MSGDHNAEQLEIDYEEASLASDEPFGVGATPKVKPGKPTSKDFSAGYMVSIDGNIGPKKVHPTIDDAKAEAMRLSPSNAGKIIRILYLVGYYEPTHEFKELV
jgi:hypothetical protein